MPDLYLAWPMGSGKTITTLSSVNVLMYQLFEVQKVLVIAPLQVAEHTWAPEAGKWDHTGHLRVSRILGDPKARLTALEADADLYVINRENLPWLVQHYTVKNWPFDMVVFDEADGLKDRGSVRFKALRHVRPAIKRMLFLSGTPTPSGLEDLWSQIFLLDGGQRLYRTITAYRGEYFEPDQINRRTGQVYSYKPKPDAAERIHAKVADIMFSLDLSEHLDLPERIDVTVAVTLPSVARAHYRELVRELVILDSITAPSSAVLTNKLRQIASGAVYNEDGHPVQMHTAKYEALRSIIAAADGPVLVFYDFKHSLTRIQALGGVCLDVEGWNQGSVFLMALHPASAGHGLNLQAGGAIVVWYDLPWSLGLYQQANARLHRQGQTKPVRVYHLVADDTVEQAVVATLGRKEATQDALMQAIRESL